MEALTQREQMLIASAVKTTLDELGINKADKRTEDISAAEPKVLTSARYSITEAAHILGIHIKTLRNHTNEGVIKCGFRRANGRRFYLGSEILRYWKSQY